MRILGWKLFSLLILSLACLLPRGEAQEQKSACGTQDAAGKTSSTISSAAKTISTLGSVFGKKKPAPKTDQGANAAADCPPQDTNGTAVSGSTAGTDATSNAPPQDSQAPGKGSATQSATKQAAGSTEPWTPPADSKSATGRAGPAKIEPEKMPDIIGVHLGMDPKEALAVVHAHYPKNQLTSYDTNMSTFPTPVFQGTIVNPADNYQDDFNFQTTLPPEKQFVWKVRRVTKAMHVNRETLLAALRAKYGKESVAFAANSNETASSDAQISELVWLFDESGRHIPVPNSSTIAVRECEANVPDTPGTAFLMNEAHGDRTQLNGWCVSSYVAVHVQIGAVGPIIELMSTQMVDLPLAYRTAHSTAVWYRAEVEKARQRDLEKSKQAKPSL